MSVQAVTVCYLVRAARDAMNNDHYATAAALIREAAAQADDDIDAEPEQSEPARVAHRRAA